MVLIGDPAADLPPETTDDLDINKNESGVLILSYGVNKVRRDGYGDTGEERRPDVDVVVALVAGGKAGGDGDLLVFVLGEDIETVVVDSDSIVGVSGVDGDLEVGGEEVGAGGEIELVDCGVL
ncbi:hypothetical protein IEQ34_002534 [Dendrobium chrysotoxum]|uniref:Uncharacterized protein n=1 Tax=Dendrobium chrysotoxum TaxID=161865 RepID=A0AAV7HK52_DENCH|nr:hypothetical protein IEQ34_002534 [Dendrobium chrysotoxum]